MDTTPRPYGAASARTDAARLRKATAAEAADIVREIRNRLMATEGCRRPDIDIDYPDVSDALVIADESVKAGAFFVHSDLKRLAAELDAAADALDELITNKPPKRTKKATPLRNQTRTADQIWPERNRSK